MSASFYRAFEDRYRGSRELIGARLRKYLDFVRPLASQYPAGTVLDLGCGRGEWLEMIRTETAMQGRGVDLDDGMLAASRERGLDVAHADALATLRALPDASVALISAFHLVEHLPFDDVQHLVAQALRALKPGGLLIMETPNPENLAVGTESFYLDPSHVKPVPSLLLGFLTEFGGFSRHAILRLQEPYPLHESSEVGLANVLDGVSPDYAVVAQKAALPEELAPFDAAFQTTYGISLRHMMEHYDQQAARRNNDLASQLQHVRQQADARDHELTNVYANLSGGVKALDAQATAMGTALAAVDAGLRATGEHFTQLAETSQGQQAALEARLGHAEQQLAAVAALIERQLQWEETDTAQAISARLQLLEKRVKVLTRNDTERSAGHARELALATNTLHEAEVRLRQAKQESAALHDTVLALHLSTSWRLTAPMRWAMHCVLRLRSAIADGRLASGLLRRALWTVRSTLYLFRIDGFARKMAIPVLRRIPHVDARMRRVMYPDGPPAPEAPPNNDLHLPIWPAPLPAEFAQLPLTARKALLDLAGGAPASLHL